MTSRNIAELIGLIRDQREISASELAYIITSLTNGTMNDAQVGAFAMAVLCRGLDDKAATALTKAMRDSGEVMQWNFDGPIVDKHSTGGVGDTVSLALAPILAVSGRFVPMISGRGLGHTGGTLDKLEAIKGFSTELNPEQMQKQLRAIGCAMARASALHAPADKRLYAIRDVTGSVPSPELITSSILSKKLAAGLEELVLDIKVGSGAFMKNLDDARSLAQRLVRTAGELGLQTSALLTAMDIPLASSAGNALEVLEILRLLEGQTESPLYEVTKRLCMALGMSENEIDGIVHSGRAMEKFEQMCFAQGGAGDARTIQNTLPKAPIQKDLTAWQDFEFHGFDSYEVGMCVITLGGGRKTQDDILDLSVGISEIAKLGSVKKGDHLATIHARNHEEANEVIMRLKQAVRVKSSPLPLVIEEYR